MFSSSVIVGDLGVCSAWFRDSATSDEEVFSSLDELSTRIRHLRSSKRCKCVVVGMDSNLQLPGDVGGFAGKGIWRHDFDEIGSKS